MNRVLDASAMIAYLDAETGGLHVKTMLAAPSDFCYAHVMNLVEVYYHYVRTASKATALLAIRLLEHDGVLFRGDMDTAFWQEVGDIKAGGKISLPDCFCVVLSRRLRADAVTADRTEFTPIQTAGLCPVFFIR